MTDNFRRGGGGAERKSKLFGSVGQRADMNILRGGAQPKKSESLSQVFSQSLTENVFCFNRHVLHTVGCLKSAQPPK